MALSDRLGGIPLGFVTTESVLRDFQAAVRENGEFRPRPALEEDPSYLQVIVQGLVCDDRNVLALFRRSRLEQADRFVEVRHNAKVALASGGHVEPVEAGADDILVAALLRELNEELVFATPVTASDLAPLGIVCTASPEAPLLERVHVGMVYQVLARGSIRLPKGSDEFDALEYCDAERLRELFPRLEEWGRLLAGDILERRLLS